MIQSAIIHAQFELLHPFNDGNGRIGRLLIPLVLFRKGRLSQPVFYISSYLEKNRESYYHSLLGISSNEKDWNGWIEFFLKAVAIEARSNSRRVCSIRELYDEMKISVQEITGSKYAMAILDALFDRPKFQVTEFRRRVNIPRNTVMDALNLLKDKGILQELTPARGRRSAVLGFGKLLKVTGTWELLEL